MVLVNNMKTTENDIFKIAEFQHISYSIDHVVDCE